MVKLNRSRMHIILLAVTAVLAVGAFLIFRQNQDSSTGGVSSNPQSGNYTIAGVESMVCTLKLPPDCNGKVKLASGSAELLATIDRNTKVRYQKKEIQAYPDALKKDMTVDVTFKPNSNVIDTAVIAE